MQPISQPRHYPYIAADDGTRSSFQQSTASHVASQVYGKMGSGVLRPTRSVKPQINLNRKSEVYHTQKNLELLQMCEQPEVPHLG